MLVLRSVAPGTRDSSTPASSSCYHIVTRMKLPGANKAVVAERKVTAYLLSRTHPTGRHKARWLISHGFAAEAPGVLVEALKLHATTHELASTEMSPFGTRYVVEGELVTPDGQSPRARSVWFIEADDDTPQFVTVYPVRGGRA